MKNTIGDSVSITLFGESHGAAIGGVLDGLCSGIKIDEYRIKSDLERRKGINSVSTSRREPDEYRILSGVFNGFTTGTPISLIIENKDCDSSKYDKDLPRPSHADLCAEYKYRGFQDHRGGGHFSGRITAPIVALGTICKTALEGKGIKIISHIKQIGDILDKSFSDIGENEILSCENEIFPTVDKSKKNEMLARIESVKNNDDSIGGIIEVAVIGIPKGIGEPWFDTLEGEIAKMVFSVPAVKGIEFGKGFGFAKLLGSEANDEYTVENGEIKTKTNNNSGILGGISNSMPIIFSAVIKPTASIGKKQNTVSLDTMKETEIEISGRHDPCIVPRASAVIENCVAITLCDMLARRFGTDYLRG